LKKDFFICGNLPNSADKKGTPASANVFLDYIMDPFLKSFVNDKTNSNRVDQGLYMESIQAVKGMKAIIFAGKIDGAESGTDCPPGARGTFVYPEILTDPRPSKSCSLFFFFFP
jgi:hypothetical protein